VRQWLLPKCPCTWSGAFGALGGHTLCNGIRLGTLLWQVGMSHPWLDVLCAYWELHYRNRQAAMALTDLASYAGAPLTFTSVEEQWALSSVIVTAVAWGSRALRALPQ